ncbi:MAG TPA: FAD-dependent oxidoreductase [Pseudonocardia sp.]|jgi:NADPH-dependent 2,4-dienoyl-CoA reductase/sulfur reductase-like enzyme|uniref:NAD(P)/FAD-dependent oxidoreductase n=1 Tax=Pseudonocardia sp. TaxID=60912 RepID=UPI002B4ADDD5|nr:FAD-dependent oxidoreductase [Pseudonocardia sp.]HLU58186.1 FAD-dependent oxidoreductase [Pseudonocardia sp.]
MRTVAVIGGSLAGISAARALREHGFDGRVVVVGAEDRLPYDRPPLSKEFLADKIGIDDLALTTDADAELDLDWRLGETAVRLDPRGRSVVLASGQEVAADGVVLATGARARPWPGDDLPGVHTLRTVDDAIALRDGLRSGGRLVVIGAGFIGAEVASTARDLGVEVTVVEAERLPLAGVLGPELAAVCTSLHAEGGVRLIAGTPVAGLVGTDRVREVRLADGRAVPADVVVVGIGALPNVEWLAGSGVDHDPRGVWTDAAGATNLPNVVAAGDCTFSHCAYAGVELRQEHWTNALQQASAAAATLLGRDAAPARPAPPYFWSDQYGVRMQFAGHRTADDEVEIIEGDPDSRRFVAGYRRDGRLVAVFAMNQPKLFAKWRRQLAAPAAAPLA